jgi:RNA polymerase sigma-70 factor (ECF subfamily)
MEILSVVDKVLEGNKDAFRHIISQCNQPLYRTAIAILKNKADAEDAVQSTYLKAYLHLRSFRGDATMLTWITRILINECKMMLRKKKQPASLESKEVIEKESIMENAAEKLDKEQVQRWLENAVLELPEKYRIVYVVREVNEFSTQKTASMLGLSEENVKVRLHRAKSIIKENLLQHADVKELFPFRGNRCESFTERVMKAILAQP